MAKFTKESIVAKLGIKKTMAIVAMAMVEAGVPNVLKADKWESIVDAMKPADGSTGTSTPREITILKDVDGNQLGRQCSVTKLWFANESFNKGTTCVKLADSAKGKLYNESKVMEKAAMAIIDEARDITDVNEKVAKYEAYDKQLLEAKSHRAQAIVITDEMKEGGVESIDALAKELGVEVNPVAPEVEETEEA